VTRSTLVAVSAATFALGYLHALAEPNGAVIGHPGWFLLAVFVVAVVISMEPAP